MKYMKRANIYKASNVTFSPETMRAYSYDWWLFTDVIGGKLVFNWYTYSNTTAKHQRKVYALLRDELGREPDVGIEAPQGLQNLQSAIDLYNERINDLYAQIAKPGTRKLKNEERTVEIVECRAKILQVRKLMKARGK